MPVKMFFGKQSTMAMPHIVPLSSLKYKGEFVNFARIIVKNDDKMKETIGGCFIKRHKDQCRCP